MANRTPRYGITDKKSVLITLIAILCLGLVLVITKYSGRTKAERLSALEGLALATVKTIEENDRIEQKEKVIDSYTLEFEYTVDSIIHYGRDKLEGSEQYEAFINSIIESDFEQQIKIKYDIDDPTIALIVPPDMSDDY